MCVHQSCQLSQTVVQYCANLINADKSIKGIQIGDHGIKLVNFTGNTTIFLRDIMCLNRIEVILRLYEKDKLVQTWPLWGDAYKNRIQLGQLE